MLFSLTLFFRHKAGWWHSSPSSSQPQCPTCFPVEEQQTRLSFRAEGKTLQYHRVPTNYTITQGCRAEQTGWGQCTGTPTTGFKAHWHCKNKQKNQPNKKRKPPQQEVGEGEGQNQDRRIVLFLLTYSAVSSVSH